MIEQFHREKTRTVVIERRKRERKEKMNEGGGGEETRRTRLTRLSVARTRDSVVDVSLQFYRNKAVAG